MKVLGVDILAGSTESKTAPRYSVALLEEGELILKDDVTSYKLRNLIADLKPDRIACDNIYELFSKEGMRAFFLSLPPSTKVIQVNGTPERMEPLHAIARRYGLKLASHASMEEAIACAKLAWMNVGYEVNAFEDECYIVVSRARSMGRGGQSQDRYRRKVHNMVAANVKGIAELLDERGVKYDLSVRKADYGYSQGTFRVYSARAGLFGIRRRKGPDVQVKIKPRSRGKLEFVQLKPKKGSVILGLDPGLTVGMAVVDLDGNLLEVASSRNFSISDILSFAMKYEDVLAVACDVVPAPRLVERVASSLDSILFAPSHPLSLSEKLRLIDEKFSREAYSNAHERDALAAAVKAFNSYRNKAEHIDKKLEEAHLQEFKEETKRRVFGGESLDKILKELEEREVEAAVEEGAERYEAAPDKHKALVKSLRREIELLKGERRAQGRRIEMLTARISELERRLEELENEESRRLRKDIAMRIKEREIQRLTSELQRERTLRDESERKLEDLKKIRNVGLAEELIIMRVLSVFTREKIQEIRGSVQEGEIVYLMDASGGGSGAAEELLALRPKAIVVDTDKMSHLAKDVLRDAIMISPEKLNIKVLGDYAFADKKALMLEIARERARVERERINRSDRWLEEYIEGYRTERQRAAR